MVINEICAANGDVNYDPYFFNFPSWVELHNTGDTPVDIYGYSISDNTADAARWQIPVSTVIPPKGFLIIWCDEEALGLHTTFSLDSDGEDPVVSGYAYGDVAITAAYEALPPRTGIVINEFCATSSDQRDDYGEPADWIELFNSSENTVDIGGLYITDNLDHKKKFRIPAGSEATTMGPGGYLLLWADEEPDQGVLHVGIKLSSNGEAIGLYEEFGHGLTTLDEVVYGAKVDFESFARIPNGSGPFIKTVSLSPGSENSVISSTGDEKPVSSLYPNPAEEFIRMIGIRDAPNATISDVFGRVVKHFSNVKSEEPLDVDELKPGVYFITVRDGIRSDCFRFIKK